MALAFNPMNFVYNLRYLGLGMLGIFVVIAIVILSTYAVNALFSRPKKKKDEEQQ